MEAVGAAQSCLPARAQKDSGLDNTAPARLFCLRARKECSKKPQCQTDTALLSRTPSLHTACPSMAHAPLSLGILPRPLRARPHVGFLVVVKKHRCLIKQRRNHCGGPTAPTLRVHTRRLLISFCYQIEERGVGGGNLRPSSSPFRSQRAPAAQSVSEC